MKKNLRGWGAAEAENTKAARLRSRSTASSPPSQKIAFASITIGRRSIGHVICRGREGFEAFDSADESIGTYPDMRTAANAVAVADSDGKEAA